MKKIILAVCLLFVTGCSVSYDVYIGDDFEEVISVNGERYDTFPVPAFYYEQGASETDEKIEGIEYYTVTEEDNSKIYKYKFNLYNYASSAGVNTCINSLKISKNDNNYIINTGNDFACFGLYPNLENIAINLVFDVNLYEVESSNAHSINGNVYTWNITRNNFKDNYIQIIFKDTEKKFINDDTDTDEEKIDSNFLILIVLISFVLILGGIIYLKCSKIKKNNRF